MSGRAALTWLDTLIGGAGRAVALRGTLLPQQAAVNYTDAAARAVDNAGNASTDLSYDAATIDVDGLLPAVDKAKLDVFSLTNVAINTGANTTPVHGGAIPVPTGKIKRFEIVATFTDGAGHGGVIVAWGAAINVAGSVSIFGTVDPVFQRIDPFLTGVSIPSIDGAAVGTNIEAVATGVAVAALTWSVNLHALQ